MRRRLFVASIALAAIAGAAVVARPADAAPNDLPVAVTWSAGSGGTAVITVMGLDGSDRHNVRGDELDGDRVAWSPDGTRLAFTRNEGSLQIWTTDLSGTTLHRVTPPAADNFPNSNPAWSPDGTTIAYTHNGSVLNSGIIPDPKVSIWLVDADGRNVRRLTSPVMISAAHPAWDPHGSRVAFTGADSTSRWGIWVINTDGTGSRALVAATDADYLEPAWSPDGSKIAFVVAHDPPLARTDPWSAPPPYELAVMSRDGTNLRVITHSTTETPFLWAPAWTPDGTRIVFGSYAGDPRSPQEGRDRLEVIDTSGANRRVIEADTRSQDIIPAVAPAGVHLRVAAEPAASTDTSEPRPSTRRARGPLASPATAAGAPMHDAEATLANEPVRHGAGGSMPATATEQRSGRGSGRRPMTVILAAVSATAVVIVAAARRAVVARLRHR